MQRVCREEYSRRNAYQGNQVHQSEQKRAAQNNHQADRCDGPSQACGMACRDCDYHRNEHKQRRDDCDDGE